MIIARLCRVTTLPLHQARLASSAAAPAKKWATTTTRAPYKPRSATVTSKALPVAEELAGAVGNAGGKVGGNWGTGEGKSEGVIIEGESSEPLPEVPLVANPPTTAAINQGTTIDAKSVYPTIPFPLESNIGLGEAAKIPREERDIDWATSYHGISTQPFSERAATVLMRELKVAEIEIKPDGLLYLPEILYRRKLNEAFGPGGWGMVPRGEMTVLKMMVSREWGLIAGGRLVSVARGEQTFFDPAGLPTATEGCKSNALMRCCKDLGIASELWDPSFIRVYKNAHCVEAWTEHVSTKKKQKRWRKKGNKFEYPYKEATM